MALAPKIFILNLLIGCISQPEKPSWLTGQIEYSYSYERNKPNADSLRNLSLPRYDPHPAPAPRVIQSRLTQTIGKAEQEELP